MTYIGVDNGVSGTISAIRDDGRPLLYAPTPIHVHLSHTKKAQQISRIDGHRLVDLLLDIITSSGEKELTNYRAFLERPLVNPKRFTQTLSAVRAFEATLICFETVGIGYQTMDSREWQRVMLPRGTAGKALKFASAEVATRLFPNYAEVIKAHGDGDSLLIAEYARREKR